MAAGKYVAGAVAFQVACRQLLDFLRIKGGQGPNAMGLEVCPVLDVTDFYGVESCVNNVDTSAPGAITGTLFSAAATNPRRLLSLSGSVTIGAAAGTYLTIAVGWELVAGAGGAYVAATTVVPVVAGVYRVAVPLRGTILPAGHRMFASTNGTAGGVDHVVRLDFSYQRLDGLP